MPTEAADYICELDADAPSGLDLKSEGDNELRQLKHVLQTTFPEVCGVVTATHEELSNPGQPMPIVTVYNTVEGASTHTYTDGRRWAKITVTGGGGGSSNSSGRCGGSAGGTAIKTFEITQATSSYQVGAGGAVGSNGGDSSFNTGAIEVTGEGGMVGQSVAVNFIPALGINGDANIRGGGGSIDSNASAGGVSYFGGGFCNDVSGLDDDLGAYGAGGRGQTSGQEGLAGTGGVIIVEEY